MKTTKPLRAGVLVRPFQLARRVHAVVTVFAPFRLDAPKRLLTDMEMWLAVGEHLGGDAPFDEGLAKTSSEVLLAGSCHPQNPPQRASFAGLTISRADGKALVAKRVAVFGDREWRRGLPTEPEPFESMPLSWSRAFGGEGFDANPLGRGAKPRGDEAGKPQRLPNLEDPERLLRSPSDEPEPRSFLPYGLTWPQRMSRAGKAYDAKWLAERFPGPAEDIDPTYFHQAGDDQRFDGYLRGGERYLLENLHPEHARIEGQLPPLVGRVLVARRPAGVERPRRGRPAPEKLEDVRTRLETLWFFPGSMTGVLVFRGTTPAHDDDLADIEQLVVALEDAEQPKPSSHYDEALAARLDRDEGVLRLLDEEDLLPSAELGYECAFPELELEGALRSEGLLEANQKRAAQQRRDAARAQVEEAGFDPAAFGFDEPLDSPLVPSMREPKKLAAFVREQEARAKAEQAKLEDEAKAKLEQVRAQALANGMDWDAAVEASKREVGPPRVSLRASFEAMSPTSGEPTSGEVELSLAELRRAPLDPALVAKLEQQERALVDAYRISAHLDPEVRLPDEAVRAARRAQVELALDHDVSLDGVDLSGADLSGLDLSGRDLSGAFLEGVSLRDTSLRGARLDRAVLARADLSGADLSGASLVEANLGAATLRRSVLREVDATRAIFDRARLEETIFEGASVDDASFVDAVAIRPDLSRLRGQQVMWFKLDLREAKLDGAKLVKCMFIECQLDGASLEGAEAPKLQLVGCSCVGLRAKGARLVGSFIGHGSSLDGAVLDGADLSMSSLRTSSLVGASLVGAKLANTDLSECDASGADLRGAIAPKAMLVRTVLRGARLEGANLMEAILSKADLAECDLSHANLFRAEMSRVHLSGGTKIDDALLDFAVVEPKEAR